MSYMRVRQECQEGFQIIWKGPVGGEGGGGGGCVCAKREERYSFDGRLVVRNWRQTNQRPHERFEQGP